MMPFLVSICLFLFSNYFSRSLIFCFNCWFSNLITDLVGVRDVIVPRADSRPPRLSLRSDKVERFRETLGIYSSSIGTGSKNESIFLLVNFSKFFCFYISLNLSLNIILYFDWSMDSNDYFSICFILSLWTGAFRSSRSSYSDFYLWLWLVSDFTWLNILAD